MRIITVASGKGGVGRSTLVANLGVALAKLGKQTIVVDASLVTPSLGLIFKLEKVPYTLNDALAGESTLADVTYLGPNKLRIVPASVALEQIKKAKPEGLRELLIQAPKETDFVLIDAPSGLRRETVEAVRAGRELLLVLVPEVPSVSDAMKIRLVADYMGLKSIGIALNRTRREKFGITSDEIQQIMRLPILTEIPEDPNVRKALGVGKPVIELNPKAPASKAVMGFAKKLASMRV